MGKEFRGQSFVEEDLRRKRWEKNLLQKMEVKCEDDDVRARMGCENSGVKRELAVNTSPKTSVQKR